MEGDPEAYRTDIEKERFRQDDPIVLLETQLLDEKVVDQDRAEGIRRGALERIQTAAAFASESPLPPESALIEHIYGPEDASLYEGDFVPHGALREMSVSAAVNRAVEEEMKRDDRVFLWGEDVSLGGYFNVTGGLIEQFGPNRIIDTPISENAIIGGAVGAAITGMRPVCEILFADFLSCCMDPILNQASKLRYMTGGQVSVLLTIRTPVGSGIGMAAQHSQSMEKFFYGVPGLIVLALSDAYTAVGLTKSAIRSGNPVLVFEHKLLYAEAGKVPTEEYILPIGKARVVRAGDDVTIVTYLLGLSVALQAADLLERAGVNAEIIDLAALHPLDDATVLQSVRKTGHLVVVEEALFTGSVGSDVISRVCTAGFDLLKKAPVKIAAPDCPIPYAKNLETAMIPTPELVAERVEKLLD
jgi:2-oxoisovalerate dehydrogenase E1 component